MEPEADDSDKLLSWPGWAGRKWPVLFSCNTATDEIEQDDGGSFNVTEAYSACEYAASFLRTSLVPAHEICIMSPFRAQVRLIRKIARSPNFAMSGVNIGPLEAFQGLEKNVVILATTRTRARFLEQDKARGWGVVHEPKRFNVALTRAKHGLIVIGNPDVLQLDDDWRAFMDFCNRNGLWVDKEGTASVPYAPERRISRLERQLQQTESNGQDLHGVGNGMRQLGLARDADHELWRSGVEMEEELREEE